MRQPIGKKLRFQVFNRDEHTCQYCGAKAPHARLQLDHKIAVANGGDNSESNLITSCWDCNIGKGVLWIEEPGSAERMLQEVMDLSTCIMCAKKTEKRSISRLENYMLICSENRVPGFHFAFCYECVSDRTETARRALVSEMLEEIQKHRGARDESLPNG